MESQKNSEKESKINDEYNELIKNPKLENNKIFQLIKKENNKNGDMEKFISFEEYLKLKVNEFNKINSDNNIKNEISEKDLSSLNKNEKNLDNDLTNEPKKNKFINYKKRVINILNCDLFDFNKIVIKDYKHGENIIKISPDYYFSTEDKSQMIIQTPFMNITKKFINVNTQNRNYIFGENGNYNTDKKVLELELDPEQLSNSMIEIFKKYDELVSEHVKKNYGNSYKYQKKLINSLNTNNINFELGNIKGKLKPNKSEWEFGKIISYNISKKYSKYDVYDIISSNKEELIKNLKRIITIKKQIRFLLTPVSWLIKETKNIGERKFFVSYLRIIGMEIKYNNSEINSIVDRKTINITPSVINITI